MNISTSSLSELASLVKTIREYKSLSQQKLAEQCGFTSRSSIMDIETGFKNVPQATIKKICDTLEIPVKLWEKYTEKEVYNRLNFESILSELSGKRVSLENAEIEVIEAADAIRVKLFTTSYSPEQRYDCLTQLLTFYGVKRMTLAFFEKYFAKDGFNSFESFRKATRLYLKDAIRLFSDFERAYISFNSMDLKTLLSPIAPRETTSYLNRYKWVSITKIPDVNLPFLGYVAASQMKEERSERKTVSSFLIDLADKLDNHGPAYLDTIPEQKLRRIDSMLRNLQTRLEHQLSSPLFRSMIDADALRKEAEYLAPKGEDELSVIEKTQNTATYNLSQFISADHMDVYVATSMRTTADFISVNAFVQELFNNEELKNYRLRYFNPTQSWIKDRVAKGLVEALMLKRADFTIYMAQKEDTFGKDSEASVSLGQGKTVIVYVPKLLVPEVELDSVVLSNLKETELRGIILSEGNEDEKSEVESYDWQSLVSCILSIRLSKLTQTQLISCVRRHWADYDLLSESHRISDLKKRVVYRNQLDQIIKGQDGVDMSEIRDDLIKIFVANTVRYETRAKIFKDIHPLAFQVILSSGVLNGILVVRSVDQCIDILKDLIKNELSLRLEDDDDNYKLIENKTGSTIRVISRNKLIRNAYSEFYSKLNVNFDRRNQNP